MLHFRSSKEARTVRLCCVVDSEIVARILGGEVAQTVAANPIS
jgi:hypothetical protein